MFYQSSNVCVFVSVHTQFTDYEKKEDANVTNCIQIDREWPQLSGGATVMYAEGRRQGWETMLKLMEHWCDTV